jgi:hypothetical protein
MMKKIYIKPQIEAMECYQCEDLLGASRTDTIKGNVFDDDEVTGSSEPGRSRESAWGDEEEW